MKNVAQNRVWKGNLFMVSELIQEGGGSPWLTSALSFHCTHCACPEVTESATSIVLGITDKF